MLAEHEHLDIIGKQPIPTRAQHQPEHGPVALAYTGRVHPGKYHRGVLADLGKEVPQRFFLLSLRASALASLTPNPAAAAP